MKNRQPLPNPQEDIQEDYEMITQNQKPPQRPISSRLSPPTQQRQKRPPPSLDPKGILILTSILVYEMPSS